MAVFNFLLLFLTAFFCYFCGAVTHQRVIIIGAGPTGLAAALRLKQQGWSDIKVIERRDRGAFEIDKSYLYLIDGRGQKILECLNLMGDLKDPANSISSKSFQNLTEVKSSGDVNVINTMVDKKAIEKFWLPRSTFLDILDRAAVKVGGITVEYGIDCKALSYDSARNCILVIASTAENREVSLQADLLIGCDGINSSVRRFLETERGAAFSPQRFNSDAAGLKYKILTINPNFKLPRVRANVSNKKEGGTISEMQTLPTNAYAIRSALKDRAEYINLGLLPVALNSKYRTANIICNPGHSIWKIKSFAGMKAFLHRSFPQLVPLSEIVSDEEIKRFAEAPTGEFPRPQFCRSLYALFPDIPKHDKNSYYDTSKSSAEVSQANNGCVGVVLLGDCAHAFPPDLGQGVNSALEDVYEFSQTLSATGNDIQRALPVYDSSRTPDIEALCRLMQFGYPYQYNQAPLKKKLWMMNAVFRLSLNKLAPALFSPPAFVLIQNHLYSYRQVLKKAQRTTINILVLLLSAALLCSPAVRFSIKTMVTGIMSSLMTGNRMVFI